MAYKHPIVQGLAELIERYAGKGGDPFTRALWFGFRGQVPLILQALDSSEEAIAAIEKKLIETLEAEGLTVLRITEKKVEEAPPTITPQETPITKSSGSRKKQAAPIAEVEVVVEPKEEGKSAEGN